MIPRTPSPQKTRHFSGDGSGGSGNETGGSFPLPPPPLFQFPEGQTSADDRIRESGVSHGPTAKLHRKGAPYTNKKTLPRSSKSCWFEPIRNGEEEDLVVGGNSPISPFQPSPVFYSPAPSTMTAATIATTMSATPTEFSFTNTTIPTATATVTTTATAANANATDPLPNSSSNVQGNSSSIPFTLSPTAAPYCLPASPSYSAPNRYSPLTPTVRCQHYQHTSNGGYSTPRRSPTKRRTPTSASSTANRTVQRNDAVRLVKTELCIHYSKNKLCPFGDKCTFAHGEEELQLTKLMDRQRAGIIEDIETYRTKPCWTFVATGSCPFGVRCIGIHDPRITSQISSWLPHTETQGNLLPTDINVDGLHQKRLQVIHHDNPFGEQFSVELDDFADLYKLICNATTSNKRRRNSLSEIHKLSIALQMRGESGWMYKYRPQYKIHDTLCMELQKKAFRLHKSGDAVPIELDEYKFYNKNDVIVREIAFGPDSEPSVRGVALYFHIADCEVAQLKTSVAKKYRWKKQLPDDRNQGKLSTFDTRECFVMIRPFEKDAFDLCTRILQHRFDMVRAERLPILNERFKVIKRLKKERKDLCDTFRALKKSWINWSWPICSGRQHVDEDTSVPSVEAEYIPIVDSDAILDHYQTADSNEIVKGSAIEPLWQSFVNQAKLFNGPKNEGPEISVEKKLLPYLDIAKARLDDGHHPGIFRRLASGHQVCHNRSLPHIKSNSKDLVGNVSFDDQSERCWRSLLLHPAEGDDAKDEKSNEWEIVRSYFQKSRSSEILLGYLQD